MELVNKDEIRAYLAVQMYIEQNNYDVFKALLDLQIFLEDLPSMEMGFKSNLEKVKFCFPSADKEVFMQECPYDYDYATRKVCNYDDLDSDCKKCKREFWGGKSE